MIKKLLIISCGILFMLGVGCSQVSNSSSNLNNPGKIIIYSRDISKEITSSDKNFQKIVDLTNTRVNKNNLEFASDLVTNDSIGNCKKVELSMEFIYNESQNLAIGFKSIHYDKLFFLLKDETQKKDECTMLNTFQYSDANNYSATLGAVPYSQELADLVQEYVQDEDQQKN